MSLWKTVSTFDNQLEAHIVKGLLESENIPVFLVGEHYASVQWVYTFALGHIRLQVPPSQAAKAQEILVQYRQGQYQQNLESEFQLAPLTCSHCGSTEIQEVSARPSLIFGALLEALLFKFVLPPVKYKVCKQCKNRVDEA
ncbi:MAG: DUF2007 domain-containing protein [Methylotenera sp.]|nr:DUF2007 domain-containing protein [Methylotenera sp.]